MEFNGKTHNGEATEESEDEADNPEVGDSEMWDEIS